MLCNAVGVKDGPRRYSGSYFSNVAMQSFLPLKNRQHEPGVGLFVFAKFFEIFSAAHGLGKGWFTLD